MRIPHLNPPYDPEVADALAVMRPKHSHFETLRLFRPLTLNLPLQTAMWELARFSDATLLELLAFAGWCHAICYIANGAQVELEPWAPPFPQVR